MSGHRNDDLYAVFLDVGGVVPEGGVLHGDCAERKWPDGVPDTKGATPVYYSDTWRAEVSGICVECKLFVDPEAS